MINKDVINKLKALLNSDKHEDAPTKSRYQLKIELKILLFTYGYVRPNQRNQAVKLLAKAMYDNYWFSADDGLNSIMLATYKIVHPTASKTFKDLKKKLKNYDEALSDYVFVNEIPIINILYSSFLARNIAFMWINMFEHEKRLYGAEVKSVAQYELINAKRIQYLLHGVMHSDNKLHLSSYKRYPKQIMNKKQWTKIWKSCSMSIQGFWD